MPASSCWLTPTGRTAPTKTSWTPWAPARGRSLASGVCVRPTALLPGRAVASGPTAFYPGVAAVGEVVSGGVDRGGEPRLGHRGDHGRCGAGAAGGHARGAGAAIPFGRPPAPGRRH